MSEDRLEQALREMNEEDVDAGTRSPGRRGVEIRSAVRTLAVMINSADREQSP